MAPTETPIDYIRRHIRTVPDWPAPGVQFRDITPLLASPRVFRVLIDEFVHRYFDVRPRRSGEAARGRAGAAHAGRLPRMRSARRCPLHRQATQPGIPSQPLDFAWLRLEAQ